MWYEYLFVVLRIVNYVVLGLFALLLLVQLIEIIVALVCKKKTFPKSDKKAKIAYIIPARNESSVIYNTVKSVLDNQKYPKELFNVYVVANNCTDNTAQEASRAGAIVLVHDDPDPKHRMALYPLKYGIDYILENDKDTEIIIRLDADNHINDEFTSLMNNAYQSGSEFSRPYEGAINGAQNFFTKACSFFYCFDSRFGSRAREVMKLSAHPNGPGAAMSRKLLLESNGYDVTSICEDTEYTFNRMLEGKTIRFVEDAVVYEDLPSTGHDTAIRNKRIAAGNKVLLKEKMGKMLKMFFKTFKFTYLETYTTYIWVSIGGIFFTWFLLFFAYFFIFGGLAANNVIPLSMFNTQYFSSAIFTALIAIAITVAAFYLLFGMLVPTVMTATEYKKYGAKKKSQFVGLVFFFIIYVLFYAFSLMFGGMKKNVKWEQVKRNSDYYDKK